MKYLSFTDPHSGEEAIVTFTERWQHKDVADRLSIRDCLLGAGFVVKEESGKIVCGGRSLGLNVSARIQDTSLLHKHILSADML